METLARDGWRTSLLGENVSMRAGGGRWCMRFVVVVVEDGMGRCYAHDHLLAAQERVADELARAQGHLAFRHDCD